MKFASSILVAASLLAGCGDPIVTNNYRGDPLFSLQGRVEGNSAALSAGEVSGAIIFLNPTNDFARMDIRVVSAKLSGNYPAEFQVDVFEEPATHGLENGSSLFLPDCAPTGYTAGFLAVGPTYELSSLPSFVDRNLNTQAPGGPLGSVLLPYLEHTTVYPYQVIYAQGVEATDRLYGGLGEDGGLDPESGQEITDGFTFVSIKGWAEAMNYSACANDVELGLWESPAVVECLTVNQDKVSCVDACGQNFSGGGLPYTTCLSDCETSFPGQLSANECFEASRNPAVLDACGVLPENGAWPSVLDAEEPLRLTLGADDVKRGALFFGSYF